MTTLRRLSAVGAVLALGAAYLGSQVWGEPAGDKARKGLLTGRRDAAPEKKGLDLSEDMAPSRFSRGSIAVYKTLDGDTLFGLQLKPKLDAVAPRPRDVILMVDTSASQVGAPLLLARQIVQSFVEKARVDDRIAIWTVNIPTANRDLTRGFRSPSDREVKTAQEALKTEVPLGNTDLAKRLSDALRAFEGKSGRQQAIVYLGDGFSTYNPLDDKERFRLCEELSAKEIAFFSMPIGPRLEPKNLHGFASGTGGLAVRVLPDEDVHATVKRLNETLASPILYPRKLEAGAEAVEYYPTKVPPLRTDAPTLLVGKMRPSAELTFTVEGTVAGKDVRVRMTEATPEDEKDNFFLVSMLEQWKRAGNKEAPALLRADRALALAYEQNRLARNEFLAQAEWALADDKLEAADALFAAASKLDPHDAEADAGVKVVKKMREGKLTKAQLRDRLAPRPDATGVRIEKRDNTVKITRDRLLALAQVREEEEDKPDPDVPVIDRDPLLKKNLDRLAVEEQRVGQVVDDALRQARQLLPSDPDAAHDLLKRTLGAIRDNPDLSDRVRQTLAGRLTDSLRNVDLQGGTIKRAQEERLRRVADAQTREAIERQRVATEDRLKSRVRSFRNLMDQARFEEAYKEAQTMMRDAIGSGQPVEPTMIAAYDIGLAAHHLRELRELRLLREERFLLTLLQVERSHVPFPDEPPIQFPPASYWREITRLRKEKYESSNLGPDTPKRTLELRDKLNKPVTLDKGIDPNTPLKDALEFLSDKEDLTIIIDTEAFKAEGLAEVESQAVKLSKMSGVSLGTVLRLLLGQLQVPGTYLIRRDYIEITTSTRALSEKAVRAYPVADLVYPIANSVNPLGLNQNLTILGAQNVAQGAGGGFGLLGGALNPFGGGAVPIGVGIGGGFGGALGAAGGGVGGNGGFGANLGFAGGPANQGFGGGFTGFGGGQQGQFGNLGGQFGLQGGDTSAQLVQLITQVIARGEWANISGFNQPTSQQAPQGAQEEEQRFLDPQQLNSLGYYPTARALIVRGTTQIHTRVSSTLPRSSNQPPPMQGNLGVKREGAIVLNPNAKKPGDAVAKLAGAADRDNSLIKKDAPKVATGPKPSTVTDLDARKIWQDALAKGVTDPGLIIAAADFLAEYRKFDHAAEFLKANLRQGIVARPWVYDALAIALQSSGGAAEDIERAQVSAIDLEPQDASGYLQAAKAMSEHKRYDRAVAFCRQAALLEPNAPDAYSDALVFAESGKDGDAMTWAARNLLRRDWPDQPELHVRARVKASTLAEALTAERRNAEAQRLKLALDQERERDLVVKLTWEGGDRTGDSASLTLKVKEPIGTVCSSQTRQTPGGGVLIGDRVKDLKSEYVAAQAFSGVYDVTVECLWGRPLGGKATVWVIQHEGTPRETRMPHTFVFDGRYSLKVRLDEGRRTSLAAVPPPSQKKEEPVVERDTHQAFNKLRNLAEPHNVGMENNMRGGLASAGVPTPQRVTSRSSASRNPADQVTYQSKVTPSVASGADLAAQATVSSDRKSVRLSLSPVYQTMNRPPSGPLVTSPLLPGAP